jgi:hypothetical protein
VNIRLHGTPEECAAAASMLARTLGLTIQDISRPYRDCNSRLVRVYLTVALEQAALPDGTPAGDGGRGETGGR